MSDVAHHEVGGEGVFGDEQHWPLYVYVQGDPALSLGTKVLLNEENGKKYHRIKLRTCSSQNQRFMV